MAASDGRSWRSSPRAPAPMSEDRVPGISAVWDLERERLTLGGALVLRQEVEILAQLHGVSNACVHGRFSAHNAEAARRIAESVFGSSALEISLTENRIVGVKDEWPTADARAKAEFSYFSYERVTQLYLEHGLAPRLTWSSTCASGARALRARFSGRLVCLHLKRVEPFLEEDSNADLSMWRTFLRAHAEPGVTDFLVLGSDDIPSDLFSICGVTSARDAGVGLAEQLCIVTLSDGFLAMASGICSVATFSSVPHVIFKHPTHHRVEMDRELGAGDRFEFSAPRQCLWRRVQSVEALAEALDLVLS
jgi:hypothetical protein